MGADWNHWKESFFFFFDINLRIGFLRFNNNKSKYIIIPRNMNAAMIKSIAQIAIIIIIIKVAPYPNNFVTEWHRFALSLSVRALPAGTYSVCMFGTCLFSFPNGKIRCWMLDINYAKLPVKELEFRKVLHFRWNWWGRLTRLCVYDSSTLFASRSHHIDAFYMAKENIQKVLRKPEYHNNAPA